MALTHVSQSSEGATVRSAPVQQVPPIEHGGRQYVVFAAGGPGRAGWRLGDHLIAYALPAGSE